MRYFRANSALYEQIRAQLDAAYQVPAGETSIPPADQAPTDENGLRYVAVRDEHCATEPWLTGIQQALQAGAEEVSEADYQAVLPQGDFDP